VGRELAAAVDALAAWDEAQAAPDPMCKTCRHATDKLRCAKLGEWVTTPCAEWEPKPAAEGPKCVRCGMSLAGLVNPAAGVCPACYASDAEARRIERLRERLKPGVCVQHIDGRQGIVTLQPVNTICAVVVTGSLPSGEIGSSLDRLVFLCWEWGKIACILVPEKEADDGE